MHVPDGAVGGRADHGPVEAAVIHAERLEQRVAHHLCERLALDPLQYVAGEVDTEIRVGVPAPDREAQPGVGDAAHVRVERAGIELVVVSHRRLVREAGGVAEEHPKRDLPLWVLLECAVDGELGQVGRDRRVEVDAARRGGLHDRRRREQLRHRLALKIVSAVTGAEPPPSTIAEALDPQRPVPIDKSDGKAGDTLLRHQLRDTSSIGRDDRCRRVGRDRLRRRVERTDRHGKQECECCGDRPRDPLARQA